jgi:hypothetical protein
MKFPPPMAPPLNVDCTNSHRNPFSIISHISSMVRTRSGGSGEVHVKLPRGSLALDSNTVVGFPRGWEFILIGGKSTFGGYGKVWTYTRHWTRMIFRSKSNRINLWVEHRIRFSIRSNWFFILHRSTSMYITDPTKFGSNRIMWTAKTDKNIVFSVD